VTNHYSYMVAYQFSNGSGRIFIERTGLPIDSPEAVEGIEETIRKKNPHLGPLHVSNFVLLREYDDE